MPSSTGDQNHRHRSEPGSFSFERARQAVKGTWVFIVGLATIAAAVTGVLVWRHDSAAANNTRSQPAPNISVMVALPPSAPPSTTPESPPISLQVGDVGLKGTCATPTLTAAWRGMTDCSPGIWYADDASVVAVCAATGPEYDVFYGPRDKTTGNRVRLTWHWYFKTVDHLYVHAGAISGIADGSNGYVRCPT